MNSKDVGFLAALLLLVVAPLGAQERPYLISVDSAKGARSLSGSPTIGKVCPLVGAAVKSRAAAKSVTSIVLTDKVYLRPGAWDDPENAASRDALNAGRPEDFANTDLHPDEIAERNLRAQSPGKRKALEAQIKQLEDRREYLMDTLLDDNVDSGTGGEDAVEKEIDDIKKKIAKLNQEMSELP